MMVINTITLNDCSTLSINRKEAMRYLGVKTPDGTTLDMLNECEKELYKLSQPKAVYSCVDISLKDGIIDFGFMKVESKSLAKNLENCNTAYIFCATLGIGLDRYYERLSKISQAKATVFSSCASSLIESFCDYVNEKVIDGKEARPRFSCGYGDFCIKHQREILEFLQTNKLLGVGLTDTYMMVPVKTVTAIIGIRR